MNQAELSQKQDEQTKQKHVSYTESSPSKSNSTNLSNTTTDNKKLTVHEFVIYTRFRQFITSPGLKVDYQVVTSLSSSFRRAKALIDFQSSPLLKTILNGSPLDSAFWFNKDPNEKDLKLNFLNEYNESQQKVILQCSSIINYQEPKLYFIQGPPGTGKSYTIIGIINAIFSRLNHYQNQAKQNGNMSESVRKKFANFKLLICSPSNGGCDELTRRIKTLRDKKNSSINELVMKRECNIVRVGRNDSIHRDCEEITLEYLFKKKLDQLIFEKKSEKSESLSSHFKSLQQTEKMLTSRVKAFKMANKERELKEAESSLEELKKKIKKFQDQFAKNKSNEVSFADRKKLEIKAKEQVLKEADIIISTCNFSGNSLLDCLTAEKNNGHSQISVIIIDEAAQCLEVDTLIPLRFGCDKIIQVGDPEQLPATVLSKLAQEKGLTMSMFERIYQRFRFTDKNPIRMLYVQYRMHPEICEFPSANFYKGKLITHKEAAQKRSIIDLKPYLFLNVLNSQEIGDEISGSVYNPIEADQIVDFCKFLSGKYYKFSVGIITPYQKQVSYLKDLTAKNNLKIEVGTVDGYQGREKDIVIFSCVRARNSDRKIGFLSHRQRLNVALTRAKYALYIFGHVESLMVNEDWRNCIENAKKRNLIINLE
ncbi:unnamed protein product [Brachionus calyciflorus]|uniref:Senataxin n=1 Tax=Brachionus calyciflorus TaxID=104777 RepID=A0A814NUG7_9BILA|nr:unnamed protein product [Brachionus calyciflorus]